MESPKSIYAGLNCNRGHPRPNSGTPRFTDRLLLGSGSSELDKHTKTKGPKELPVAKR